MLSETTIENLRATIKEEYGRDVTLKEATEIANNLVNYFDMLAKIYHGDKFSGQEVNKIIKN